MVTATHTNTHTHARTHARTFTHIHIHTICRKYAHKYIYNRKQRECEMSKKKRKSNPGQYSRTQKKQPHLPRQETRVDASQSTIQQNTKRLIHETRVGAPHSTKQQYTPSRDKSGRRAKKPSAATCRRRPDPERTALPVSCLKRNRSAAHQKRRIHIPRNFIRRG
jgi:hypothetical protein